MEKDQLISELYAIIAQCREELKQKDKIIETLLCKEPEVSYKKPMVRGILRLRDLGRVSSHK